MMARLGRALKGCLDTFLSEDYVVFAVHELEPAQSADALLADHGDDSAFVFILLFELLLFFLGVMR